MWKQSLKQVKQMNVEPSPHVTIQNDLRLSEPSKIGIDTKLESPVLVHFLFLCGSVNRLIVSFNLCRERTFLRIYFLNSIDVR